MSKIGEKICIHTLAHVYFVCTKMHALIIILITINYFNKL